MAAHKYCPKCGEKISGNSVYCPNCGTHQPVSRSEEGVELLGSEDRKHTPQPPVKIEVIKKKIKKSEEAIKSAGNGGVVLGFIALFVAVPLNIAIESFESATDIYIFACLAFCASLILIFAGLEARQVYIKNIRFNLWMILLFSITMLGGIIPLLVVAQAIIAVTKIGKFRDTQYFRKKQQSHRKEKPSLVVIIFVLAGVITLVAFAVWGGSRIESKVTPIDRTAFMSQCVSAADHLSSQRANEYCSCVFDQSLRAFGIEKQYDLLNREEISSELQTIVDSCNS